MIDLQNSAKTILSGWKKESYSFGAGAIENAAGLARKLGDRAHLVCGATARSSGFLEKIEREFAGLEITIAGRSRGAAENSPLEDVERVRADIAQSEPDVVVSLGGGSLIDAAKASIVLACCGGRCDDYFGVGRVVAACKEGSVSLVPHLAIMTASASAAHLTKYANVTNLQTKQKKLVIDPVITPNAAVFDYAVTASMSTRFTAVGAWDGIGHLCEVYYGFPQSDSRFRGLETAVLTGLELILKGLPAALADPANREARVSLGLATDLGGYAIMTGSTNGPHLNSFSLVDVAEHGLAVAVLQAYYGCFFTPVIEEKIRNLLHIFLKHGYGGTAADPASISGRALGMAYGQALQAFARATGMPTRVSELKGFTPAHREKILGAAKDPALSSKLESMPRPMRANDVDHLMGPLLDAAISGDLSLVPDVG
jgi:alcohol dehydrogenase